MNRTRAANTARGVLLYVVLGSLAAVTVVIIFWVIMVSFKTNQQLFANAWSLPDRLHLENYGRMWVRFRMREYTLNTIIIAASSLVLMLVLATPASYALSRRQFKSAEALTIFFIVGIGLPYQLTIIPLVPILARIGLMDTRAGVIVTYASFNLPFTVFLLIGFFRTLPSQLEESARLDGCGEFAIFRRIMLPLVTPGLVTAVVFNLIFVLNDYFISMIIITDAKLRPMSLGLFYIQGSMQYTQDWVSLFAAANILMVPTIIIFLFLSERVISGITLGAVKG